MTVYTIGSSGKSLRRFAELIKTAGVDCVVDIRLNNTSQLLGYAKGDDLQFVLELMGIGYEHILELAPDQPLLDAYRKDKDWNAYCSGFLKLTEDRDMLSIGRRVLGKYKAPCLMCSEDSPERCHRKLVVEYWAENIPDVDVVHLR